MFKSKEKESVNASKIWKAYQSGKEYLGRTLWSGSNLFDRVDINSRYYEGDQWRDAQADDMQAELAKFNICKQIGQAQVAIVGSNTLTAMYSWENIDSSSQTEEEPKTAPEVSGYFESELEEVPSDSEMRAVANAMTMYYKTVAKRLKLDYEMRNGLLDAFKSGSTVHYFYWDESVNTGQKAGDILIKGDIKHERLEITQVYFGDPTIKKVQEQPYIILETRKSLADVKREARMNKIDERDIDSIKPDKDDKPRYNNNDYEVGYDSSNKENAKTTVLIYLWKEYDEQGNIHVYAIKTAEKVVIKQKTDIGISVYPVAHMSYEDKRGTIYGHTQLSEIISTQRQINVCRYNQVICDSLSAQPILMYDQTKLADGFTNEIGAQIPVQGDPTGVARYLQGQQMAPSSENIARTFMDDTLNICNVNSAIRGDMNPDNTSAIIALRDAAQMPLQLNKANLYSMAEDVAVIIGQFVLSYYDKRKLKIEEKGKSYFIPFDAERYKDYLLSVSVDVGESTLWSETATVRTLDNAVMQNLISPRQYFERMPKGYIPMQSELVEEKRKEEEAQVEAIQAQAEAEAAKQSGTATSAEGQKQFNYDEFAKSLSPEEAQVLEDDPNFQAEVDGIIKSNTANKSAT